MKFSEIRLIVIMLLAFDKTTDLKIQNNHKINYKNGALEKKKKNFVVFKLYLKRFLYEWDFTR